MDQPRGFPAEQSRPSSSCNTGDTSTQPQLLTSLLETSSLDLISSQEPLLPNATPSSQVPFSLQITQRNQRLHLLTRENKKDQERLPSPQTLLSGPLTCSVPSEPCRSIPCSHASLFLTNGFCL